ncbi:hypothetical protein [Accumulibacter sp.]|uniref:hypothetical protein n=1 Tax=Accumulibacter sp. TaxID=2053492 RepID=UPI002582BAD9|nr:hypothetical protein [Accumulibacter sp.]
MTAIAKDEAVMRLSMDCKATVKIGDYSRGGKTRVTTGLPTTTWGARKTHAVWCRQ